jgi:hypothetical protein
MIESASADDAVFVDPALFSGSYGNENRRAGRRTDGGELCQPSCECKPVHRYGWRRYGWHRYGWHWTLGPLWANSGATAVI